ncbi:hypothetical protein [Microbacterium sp. KSW4-4]|uniref:hypothetical protein n=1 Tax=Microbacterium sp. KSW4-4 TaxID=2851651 RepID=UPI001FFC8684|nr:hypothetical protein [Microbacterium sp. KSW4-4]MCK2034499.1 hypothetical protein [Microbacterium sp. KSW4-4]
MNMSDDGLTGEERSAEASTSERGQTRTERSRQLVAQWRNRRASGEYGGAVAPTQEERDHVCELTRAVFDGSLTLGMTIGDDDEWINTESGTLHRGRCVTAAHMLDGLTQTFAKVGETLDGRPVLERVPQNHTAHIAPVGLGVSYTRVCRRCMPQAHGDRDE